MCSIDVYLSRVPPSLHVKARGVSEIIYVYYIQPTVANGNPFLIIQKRHSSVYGVPTRIYMRLITALFPLVSFSLSLFF